MNSRIVARPALVEQGSASAFGLVLARAFYSSPVPTREDVSMTTTTPTYQPLSVTQLDRDRWDMDGNIAEGQGLGDAALGFTDSLFYSLPDDHPGVIAFEAMVSEAIAEITPQIGDLLYEALQRRLPWTWDDR